MATSYLPLLPPEVWTQAWNLVCSQEDLKSLGLTCCLFRSICQNRLFKEIRFSCEPSTSSTAIYRDPLTMCYPEWKERIKQGVQRMEGLSRHPAHKYSVTTMKLKGTEDLTISDLEEAFPREGVSEFYQTLVSSFLLALESFTNLRHVHLGPSITITDEFVHALSRLPNLDELVIRGPFLTSIASPMIAVKVLRLSDNKDGVSGLGLFSGQRMTSLNLRNITSPDSLLRHEIARQEVNFLTCLVLQVEISQVPAIFSFLPSCRNLERLVISPFARTFENEHPLYRIPSLPRDSLPRLSSYIGPVKLAQSILPGRPVIDIEITGLHRRELLVRREYYGWDVETLEDTFLRPLRQTSVPLRRLYAPLLALSDKMLEVICRYFPQLQSLELGLDYRTIRRSKITKEGKRLMAFLQENDPSTDFNSYLAQNETGLPDSLEENDSDSGFYENEAERPHLLKVAAKDICEGRAPLPKGLASLKISVACVIMPKGYHVWPIAEECATVLTLSRLYPALELLAFGYVDVDEIPVRHWVRNKNTGGRWELSVPPPEEDTEFP